MIRYILKRLLLLVPVIVGISFIIFLIMDLTPGDPARLILGENATNEEVESLREEMGLNRNFFVRYFDYVFSALRGDFGKSYRTKLPVFDEIIARIPCTVGLAFWSTLLMIVIGIPIGIISAVKQYSLIDSVSLIMALLLTSMPIFWLGLMLVLLFSLKLGWLPATGIETWKHYILPSVSLMAAYMATLVRMTRSSMLEVIKQDYIRTARAKGADEKTIIIKHAMRNALLPIITVIGLNFGMLLGGTVLAESVFAIPGLGTLTVNSVRMKDTPLVMACVLLPAVIASLINLMIDVLYAYIDPRLKSQYSNN